MNIKCNAKEASDAMEQRYWRFEALACHLGQGIQDGINAHNTHEVSHGFVPASPDEIIMSMADAVASYFKYDAATLAHFTEMLRTCRDEEFLEML